MTLSDWANLSLVLLAVEGLVVAVIEGLILYYLIRGIVALNKELRNLFPTVRKYTYKAQEVTQKTSDRIASPFIATSSVLAMVRSVQRSLIRILQTRGRA